MRAHTVRRIGDIYEVEVQPGTDRIIGLRMNSLPQEYPEFATGCWLIFCFAIWSGPDRKAIEVAIETTEELRGRIGLALLPFDDHANVKAWNNNVDVGYKSPIWIVRRSTVIEKTIYGLVDKEHLVSAIDVALAGC